MGPANNKNVCCKLLEGPNRIIQNGRDTPDLLIIINAGGSDLHLDINRSINK